MMKGINLRNILTLGIALSLVTAASGCGATAVKKEERSYRVAVEQIPANPTYHRLRWVHLPDIKPYAHEQVSADVPAILPVINIDLENSTLEEAARVLAATGRYSSYCASSVAKRKLSIKAIGTVDELAREIAKRAQVYSSVDHENREIRFLEQSS